MGFWLAAAAVLALGVAALLVRAMLSGGSGPRDASDLDVYRDQLTEVERDRDRGVIDAAEAERMRVEVSRRLLEADRKARSAGLAGGDPRWATRAAAALAALAVLAGGAALYLQIGAPGYPDLPIERRIALADDLREGRPGQAMAEVEAALSRPPIEPDARYTALMERLRTTLAERPDDLDGHILLARNEAGLGNFAAARRAQERVLEIKGDRADVADWADYTLLLVYAAGGYVSPEAEAAAAEVLRRDPSNGQARYFMGLLYAQTGRPDLAFRVWRPLLDESSPHDPWTLPVRDRIGDVARMAGVKYRPPEPAGDRGPSASDMAAAADMAPEERQEMIRGMVDGLASRLGDAGGPAEEWARLITALGVLGETDRAGAIYAEARAAFGTDAEDLALIEAAARRAGLAE